MRQRYPLHIFLFLVTVFTTMLAGAEWASGKFFFLGSDGERLHWSYIWRGLPFSLAFLGFLTVHEFGHYFTAVYHRVRCTLPYYIPIFLPFIPYNIGSFGAVIRIREIPPSRRKYFDIGVAGPLAGFVVAVGLLVYGFTHLPPVEEYVFAIHPSYPATYGGLPTEADMANAHGVRYGGSLLFEGMRWLFRNAPNMPPNFEMEHYPFLLVGFLSLFFTALNLLPIGQLDGGHVTYGLFGARRANLISRITVLCLLMIGGLGMFSLKDIEAFATPMPWGDRMSHVVITLAYFGMVYYILRRIFPRQSLKWLLVATGLVLALQFVVTLPFPHYAPNLIWLIYALLAVRVLGLSHPVALDDAPLTRWQRIMGWAAIMIFILCFSPNPITIT